MGIETMKLLATLLFSLLLISPVAAQTGKLKAWNVYANPSSSETYGTSASLSAMFDGGFCNTQGDILTRGASVWACASALPSGMFATAAQYLAGAATSVSIPPSVIYPTETTTTFGTTTSLDFSTFINTAITLTGNITTMNVSNVKAGQSGLITFIQDSTGGRTTVFNSIFKFSAGVAPILSASANAVDVLSYSCRSATFCVASMINNVE